jgi:hypothetical protein
MKEKVTTKKFPVSLKQNGLPSSRSEFVIPFLEKPIQNEFIGLKSGKGYKMGAISYIGVEIDSNEILSKLQITPKELDSARQIINDFMLQLQNFKIGNVISIEYNEDGSFILKKESSRPKSKNAKKLP